jgi:(4S)-4-hydroxy-5-phosphonooxypentane-2,3-dione isomerase
MVTYIVNIQVLPDYIDEFIKETENNVKNSRKEPGILQFDLLQQLEAPDQFVLYEVYADVKDQLAHRETGHYKRWREVVEIMMAGPRKGVRYESIIPKKQEL